MTELPGFLIHLNVLQAIPYAWITASSRRIYHKGSSASGSTRTRMAQIISPTGLTWTSEFIRHYPGHAKSDKLSTTLN